MDHTTNPPGSARRPERSELADFARRLRGQLAGLPVGELPGTLTTIDAGHLARNLGTGVNLTLASAVVTGDVLFAPDLNPAFFYSWDVHENQQPDWFRISLRFTPSDLGIAERRAYDIGWTVVPFFLDLGATVTLEASPNTGAAPASWTLDQATVRTIHIGTGPIDPGDAVHVDLVRSSRGGSWIWLQTTIGYAPPTNEP
ncbi:hypothetical protein [uncultured Leifsonia sp.]|uniref:hypothetical protein n=1 Tax=uncultured Leifsonia sp. TaxID=340359 RepID=UPI0025CD8352|nr:hypothetical protein [uncultured Leifsonia sp.]